MESRVQQMMERAYQRGILVPAFNAAYHEMVKPICETLKRLKTFGLLEVARPDIEKFGVESFSAIAELYRRHGDSEFVTLHQDHVPVVDEDGVRVDYRALVSEALGAGYDSVMIDGSRLPLEENIAVTAEVVEMAGSRGVPVEAELGAVMGHESGPMPPYEELFASGKGFTDPSEARRFVRETGVSWLSVSVGNIHGAITGSAKDQTKVNARLNIDHLVKLKEATGIPLVLHGGSGIQREYILEAIKNGLTKLNIGTDIRQAYEQALRSTGSVEEAQKACAGKMEYLIVDYFNLQGSLASLQAPGKTP
ncbi:MAG: class II fructose-bisphosphate aldolase [Spirochaetota bacterium]